LVDDIEPARICDASEPTMEEGDVPKDKSCVLLQYQDLLDFNVDNFCCRHCLKPLTKNRFEKIQVTFATSMNYYCDCKRVAKLEARTKTTKGPDGRYKHPTEWAKAHLTSDYNINNQVVLAMQQLGCGQAGAAVMGGMLSIAPSAFANTWTDMEVEIAAAQVSLGSDILDENIMKEKQKSVCKDNNYLFCVSIDNGWNNRGSGKSYNSDSSHHITVGNRTGLVVALHYMSRRCGQCEKMEKRGENNNEDGATECDSIAHDPKLCPRNYLGSSKGMEAHGTLKSCIHLHKNHNVIYEMHHG
jgi:hypothetical protein